MLIKYKYSFLILPILVVCIVFFAIRKETIDLLSKDKFVSYSSDDSAEGGNSSSNIEQNKDGVKFLYTLRSGYAYPFASFGLNKKDSSLINAKGYKLKVEISCPEEMRLHLHTLIYLNGITDKNLDPLLIRSYSNLARQGKNKYFIDIQNETRIPVWWYSDNEVHEKDVRDNSIENIFGVSFLCDYSKPRFTKQSYTLTSLQLVYNSKPFVWWAGIFISVYYIVLLLYRSFIYNKDNTVFMPIRNVDIDTSNHKEIEKIKLFIGENYMNPELKIIDIAENIGVTQKQLSKLFVKELNISIKEYINTIRIEEAKRLLHNKEIQIAEIAFQIGYNNVQHFNRIFKDKVNKTPKEYRQTLTDID